MTQEELEQVIAGMSEADARALLATEFPEEMEKEAAAEAAEGDLVEALYAYGAFSADVEAASADGELTKEASAEFAAAEQEISEAIEAAVSETGLDQIEDEGELHKKAQASAVAIFSGWVDQLDKVAKADGMKILKATLKRKHGNPGTVKTKLHLRKNKHAYMAGAAGLAAGVGGGALRNKMEKNASELTVDEMACAVLEKQAALDIVADGIEKLAAIGEKAGKAFSPLKKHLANHKSRYAAAGAAGGAAGYLAARMARKEKK